MMYMMFQVRLMLGVTLGLSDLDRNHLIYSAFTTAAEMAKLDVLRVFISAGIDVNLNLDRDIGQQVL